MYNNNNRQREPTWFIPGIKGQFNIGKSINIIHRNRSKREIHDYPLYVEKVLENIHCLFMI